MRRVIAVLTLCAAMSAIGCALVGYRVSPPGATLTVPAYKLSPTSWAPGHMLAGVGSAEITPPPGFPNGGDGPAGNLARGYWTRLYARAFFFADSSGRTTVLVSLETFAVPGGLTAMVAREVGLKWNTSGIVVRPSGVMISATHTHQGPGNFLTAGSYNQFGSRYAGFSRPLFDFLVGRTTAAIDMAIDDALAHRSPVQLIVRTTRAENLQMNRSPSTFLLNASSRSMMDSFHAPQDICPPAVHRGEASQSGWDLHGCPRLRAADPSMTTLELQRDGARIGVLIFFAMHPTVLDPMAPVNSSDFAGVAVATLERDWAARNGTRPVVAFFNGAEGDIVTRREVRDVREVIKFARAFADAVDAALKVQVPPLDAGPVSVRREFVGAGASCSAEPKFKLTDEPVIGAAALGGAEDDRSALFPLGWREGARTRAKDDQGPKLPALDSELLPSIRLTSVFGPPRTLVRELPLQFVRIGAFSLAAFPAELSTAAGVMVRERMSGYSPLVLVGLANEYTNYAATPDEYGAQDYMAASTLWGPFEAALFACRMQQLAASASTETWSFERKDYSPGPKPEHIKPPLSFGPAAVGVERAAPEDELEKILLRRDGNPARNLYFVEWNETVAVPDDDFTAASRRVVRIQVKRDGKEVSRPLHASPSPVDDDAGTGFVTMLRHSPPDGAQKNEREWRAFWIAPLLDNPPPAGSYRFEIEIRDILNVVTVCHSNWFTLPSRDGRPEALKCDHSVVKRD